MAEQRIRRNADGTPANQTSSNNSSDSSVTRTTGRVDHPVGKQQYMDKEERPVSTGRVDHPAGKQQYMDPVEPEQNPFEEADKGSTVTVSYSIKVISCPDKSRVKNILSARRTPVQGDITLPITVSYSEYLSSNLLTTRGVPHIHHRGGSRGSRLPENRQTGRTILRCGNGG